MKFFLLDMFLSDFGEISLDSLIFFAEIIQSVSVFQTVSAFLFSLSQGRFYCFCSLNDFSIFELWWMGTSRLLLNCIVGKVFNFVGMLVAFYRFFHEYFYRFERWMVYKLFEFGLPLLGLCCVVDAALNDDFYLLFDLLFKGPPFLLWYSELRLIFGQTDKVQLHH